MSPAIGVKDTSAPGHSAAASENAIRSCCPRSWRGRGRCSIRRSSAARLDASFVKLNPLMLVKNPVMFVVEVGAALTTVFLIRDIAHGRQRTSDFRFRSHCGSGSRCCSPTSPKPWRKRAARPRPTRCARRRPTRWRSGSSPERRIEQVASSALRAGDVVLCEAGDLIPGDGEVIEGIATVDESVITGESAPVIRESGGDRSAVTGGTKVLSDHIKIRITSNPGETFLDRMIALVEGAERQKTPNEIALNILIAGLTLIFLLAVVTLQPVCRLQRRGGGVRDCSDRGGPGLAAGLPDPDDHRRPAVRHRHRRHGSGHAAQRAGDERKGGRSAGDVNSLLLDKTGTITLGNRQAVEFLPVNGVTEAELADAAQLSSLADETPEGRSDRRAGEREIRAARPAHCRARGRLHSLFGLHAHERRRFRRTPPAQGRNRCDLQSSCGSRAAQIPPELMRDLATGSRARAERRLPWPTGTGCSASST